MKNKGFTLIELLTAGFILITLVAVTATFVVFFFQNYSFVFEKNQSISQGQFALTTMIRDIREIRIAQNGAWPIKETNSSSFIFFADVTNDGKSDQVRYFLEGTDLKKGVIEPTLPPVTYPPDQEKIKTIASFIENNSQPLFTFYNGNWPADTVNNPLIASERILNTRYISIYLRVNIPDKNLNSPLELTSGVQIRNLKDNL